MSQQKTKGELLNEQLVYKRKSAAELMTEAQQALAFNFCEPYKNFLNKCKTEREAVDFIVAAAQKAGFSEYENGKKYSAGDKVYYNNRGKAAVLITFGTKSVVEGLRISASHIDSPRLDLKPSPLYEDTELALFKTHYYGGIKKYQWPTAPMALHGVIVKKNGEKVKVSIGEDPGDPVLTVTDLLVHLSKEQMTRTLAEGVKAEELNVLVGSLPFLDEKAENKVKLNVMCLLNEKYGIVEADLHSAELCVVPAYSARDVGLDRSMIGSYGHDDRVCAYTSLMAALAVDMPTYTSMTIFSDKEEIGSCGNSGLQCDVYGSLIEALAYVEGVCPNLVFKNSLCLSADVTAAFDPTFPDVMEKNNSTFFNYGVAVNKYTGSRGKYDSSDASAEMMAYVRRLFESKGIVWQTGEMGKVDAGGGGTVAMYVAHMNVDVVDVGVPVLSMHSMFEVVSKLDVYCTYLAFKAFLEDNEPHFN